jgi:hypothetical protein
MAFPSRGLRGSIQGGVNIGKLAVVVLVFSWLPAKANRRGSVKRFRGLETCQSIRMLEAVCDGRLPSKFDELVINGPA